VYENDEKDLVFNTLVKVFGWVWVQDQSLFQMTYQYFIYANSVADELYQKQYDRYLATLDKVQEPTPPPEPLKWCFNAELYNQYLEDNNLEILI
jgi:hypothetical protein